jgi:ribosomal protein L37AE/L43A
MGKCGCVIPAHTKSGKGDVQDKSEEKGEIRESSAPQDTELQKKCPMCGGQMNFHHSGEMWMCYSCAYEESGKEEVQGKSEEKSEHTNVPNPSPASELGFDLSPPLAVPLTSLSSNEHQEPIKGSIQRS